MKGLMEQALGDAWAQLPPALQAHHLPGATLDVGCLDIDYPAAMQPLLSILSRLGALVRRRGRDVATQVAKSTVGGRQRWRRTMRYPDGRTLRFDSTWELLPGGVLREWVNPWLALEMKPVVVGRELHLHGVRFVARLGRLELGIPEALALGHTTIVERAVDAHHFAMDFRLIHPLFGQVFRYAGTFRADAGNVASDAPRRAGPPRT